VNPPRTIQENIDSVQVWVDEKRSEQNDVRAGMRFETNSENLTRQACKLIHSSGLIAQAENWLTEWRLKISFGNSDGRRT
jgi:hypothetical protein